MFSKSIRMFISLLLVIYLCPTSIFAHSGGTDSFGGHHDYQNASGLGGYHYHHGIGPHLHPGGICPYANKNDTIIVTPSRTATPVYAGYPNNLLTTSEINDLQTKLKTAGFYKGSVDGKFGPMTFEAVKAFQKSRSLPVNGLVDSKTKTAIAGISSQTAVATYKTYPNNLLTTSEINDLQTKLKTAGFYKGSVDGKFGPMTFEAVKAFQKSRSLPVNGLVDSKTKESILQMY